MAETFVRVSATAVVEAALTRRGNRLLGAETEIQQLVAEQAAKQLGGLIRALRGLSAVRVEQRNPRQFPTAGDRRWGTCRVGMARCARRPVPGHRAKRPRRLDQRPHPLQRQAGNAEYLHRLGRRLHPARRHSLCDSTPRRPRGPRTSLERPTRVPSTRTPLTNRRQTLHESASGSSAPGTNEGLTQGC